MLGSGYTQDLVDIAVDLGAHVPFATAARLFQKTTGASMSPATVRRLTLEVGQMQMRLADEENAQLHTQHPEPSPGTEQLVMEADGAMVPLLGGEWAEVKLLVLGVPHTQPKGEVRLTDLSYVARLADAQAFSHAIYREWHRRAGALAETVAAVQDGALWLQGLVEDYRPDAVRILDWPHASQRITQITDTMFPEGSSRSQQAAKRLRTWLWDEGPERVLRVLERWQVVAPACAPDVAYLQTRRAALDYPTFRHQGWPVGSGAVEGGHKHVMQARLKGPGKHWHKAHVNPMLALRELFCNQRWDAQGPGLLDTVQTHRLLARQLAQRQRHQLRHPPPSPSPLVPSPPVPSSPRLPKPTTHPWRRYGVSLSAKS